MKRKKIAALGGATALVAASVALAMPFIPGTNSYQSKSGQTAISNMLNDPSSALFRGVRVIDVKDKGKTSKAVCGEVNGKNGFGAYAGYRRFFYEPNSNFGAIEPSTSYTSDDVDREYKLCNFSRTFNGCPRAKEIENEIAMTEGFKAAWQLCAAS